MGSKSHEDMVATTTRIFPITGRTRKSLLESIRKAAMASRVATPHEHVTHVQRPAYLHHYRDFSSGYRWSGNLRATHSGSLGRAWPYHHCPDLERPPRSRR